MGALVKRTGTLKKIRKRPCQGVSTRAPCDSLLLPSGVPLREKEHPCRSKPCGDVRMAQYCACETEGVLQEVSPDQCGPGDDEVDQQDKPQRRPKIAPDNRDAIPNSPPGPDLQQKDCIVHEEEIERSGQPQRSNHAGY